MVTTGAGSRCPTCGQHYAAKSGYCSNDGSRLVEIASHAPSQPAEHLLGRVLEGRYRVDAIAGVGSASTVYRALQFSIDREVIIKLIHPAITRQPDVEQRLTDVARLACQISAPSIANTFDFGRTEEGALYLVMELVRGRTLAEEIGGRPLAARRVVGIALQILDALDAAQKKNLVHGCLTPSNVMIADESTRRDVVKVVDFGLAPPAGGNPADEARHARYWAPEQFDGKPPEPRTDLYAFGCILYEALTGTPPFNDNSIDILRNRHRSATPPKLPTTVPLPLVNIVEKLLAKSPDARYRFVADVRRDLEPLHVASSTPVSGLGTPGRGVPGEGTYPPGSPRPGTVPPNTPYPGTYPPGTPYPGTYPPNSPRPGTPPGTPYPGTYPPGTPYPGTYPPGSPYPGTYPPGTPYPGTNPPGNPKTNPPGTPYPGTNPPGTPYPGTNPPGTPYPGTYPPNSPRPGTAPPGTPHPGTNPPGTPYPGTNPPGTPHPGTYPGSPSVAPQGASEPSPPSAPNQRDTKSGSRALVIAIVAIVVSALGVLGYVLAS